MLSAFPNDWPIPTAALLQFVMEGDNRADALALAAVVAKVFDLDVTKWKEPASWRQGLFGPPPNGELYS
jgi:proteasome assembly chaperone 2